MKKSTVSVEKIVQPFLFDFKLIFANSAFRAAPVVRQILERCSAELHFPGHLLPGHKHTRRCCRCTFPCFSPYIYRLIFVAFSR